MGIPIAISSRSSIGISIGSSNDTAIDIASGIIIAGAIGIIMIVITRHITVATICGSSVASSLAPSLPQ